MSKRKTLGFGLGLRSEYYQQILEQRPAVDWFEIISENYLVGGGKALYFLDAIGEQYPLVMHGVSLSIGGSHNLDMGYLRQLKQLADRIAKLLDEFADRFGTFCALNGDLAGRSIHFYSCILIQSLNGLRDFAHATATAHPRNTQTKHVFHLISSAAQVTARTASTLTRWQGQARKRYKRISRLPRA